MTWVELSDNSMRILYLLENWIANRRKNVKMTSVYFEFVLEQSAGKDFWGLHRKFSIKFCRFILKINK